MYLNNPFVPRSAQAAQDVAAKPPVRGLRILVLESAPRTAVAVASAACMAGGMASAASVASSIILGNMAGRHCSIGVMVPARQNPVAARL